MVWGDDRWRRGIEPRDENSDRGLVATCKGTGGSFGNVPLIGQSLVIRTFGNAYPGVNSDGPHADRGPRVEDDRPRCGMRPAMADGRTSPEAYLDFISFTESFAAWAPLMKPWTTALFFGMARTSRIVGKTTP